MKKTIFHIHYSTGGLSCKARFVLDSIQDLFGVSPDGEVYIRPKYLPLHAKLHGYTLSCTSEDCLDIILFNLLKER